MDTPICVFDAQTFVDHIHQIKTWTYGGHLRLVVPTSTSENVEQLYKKSIESKPTAQESSRPKPAGKPARKVHPAFDINPIIAREFLARIQKGKNGEPYIKERPLYEDEERWEAVQFQIPKEEYTPWKDIPVEEEKAELPDDRPLSWAELAKKKSQVNGNAEKAHAPKGPPKPKLVSKASGNDLSPWKVQKNAPKISAKEVPGHLRPLMSCALWRLHESIHRNDFNQLFLLSDQEDIRIFAKKLNITVRSFKELGEKIAASIEKTDLNVTGMLEEEELSKPKMEEKVIVPEGPTKEQTEHVVLVPSANDELLSHEDHLGQNGITDGKDDTIRPDDSISQNDMSEEHPNSEDDAATAHGIDRPCELSNTVAPIALDPKDLVQGILNASVLKAQAQHVTGGKEAKEITNRPHTLQPAAEIVEDTSNQTGEEIPAQSIPSSETTTSAAKVAVSITQKSPEDSDEEVVVFVPNPKRMSAQKKAIASSSAPTIAHDQSPATLVQYSPRILPSTVQVVPKAVEHGSPNANVGSFGRPRPLSSGPTLIDPKHSSPNVNVVPHGHPRPLSSGPTVIDPDAFGRGLTLNPGSGTLANVGTSRRSRHHSPRASMQYANPSPNPNSLSSQNSPRTSPPRHRAGRSPRPSPRALPQTMEDSPPTSIPVISHQAYTRAPLVAPNTQSSQQSRFGPIGPPTKPATNLSPSMPVRDAGFVRDPGPRQAPVQRPRSANGPGFSNTANLPHHHSPRPNPLNGFGASGRGGHHEQRSSRPSLFEPELDRTGALANSDSEPRRTNMPDVQYTLKSGTTREAARGKGKLWVG